MNWAIRIMLLVVWIPMGGMAQDYRDGNFTLWNSFGSSGTNDGQFLTPRGIAADGNGLIYVSDYGLHRIQVFSADGTFVRKWGSQGSGTNQLNQPFGMDVDANNNLYVCDSGNNRIMVFNSMGGFVTNWGTAGTGDGQFNTPFRLCVNNKLGQVFVVDSGNNRIQVFSTNGVFIRKYSCFGALGTGLIYPQAVVADDDGTSYVMAGVGSTVLYICRYTQAGAWGGSWNARGGQRLDCSSLRLTSDHLLQFVSMEYWDSSFSSGNLSIFSTAGAVCSVLGSSLGWYDLASMPDGNGIAILNIGNTNKISIYRWLKRAFLKPSDNSSCWAQIEQVAQRNGSRLLDIDYRANSDGSITNVEVAMCAFLGGTNTLANLIPMQSFAENTGTNLGPNIKTGATLRRVTWDMPTNGIGDSANLQALAFAQEGPYYLDFNFITIPTNSTVTNRFQLSSFPVTDADLKPVWMYLVARNDSAITFTSGQVFGASAPYASLLLASDSGTTTNGKNFLWERMSLRDPTDAELLWAREATIPGVQQWSPRFQVGGRPVKVNEFGVDTGAASGYWAVKK